MRAYLLIATLLLTGCASAPPSLSPEAAALWRMNEAVIALGTVQHTAIEFNKLGMLSDDNTRHVVEVVTDALITIRVAPQGHRAVVAQALTRIRDRLDRVGQEQMAAYLDTAREVVR